MDPATVEVLKQYGLKDKGVKDTMSNKELTGVLLDLHKRFGANKLMYTVGTKCDNESFRSLLGEYIAAKKIATAQQLECALQYLGDHPADGKSGNKNFEIAAGVNVEVTDAQIKAAVEAAFNADMEAIKEDRYHYNFSDILGKLKKADHVKWADAAKIRAEIDRKAAEVLGPKTQADLEGKAKKKEKPAQQQQQPTAAEKPKKAVDAATEAENELRQRMSQAAAAVKKSFVFAPKRREIQSLLDNAREGKPIDPNEIIEVGGWIRTAREQKDINFLELNDGSGPESLQVVLVESNFAQPEPLRQFLKEINTGSCVKVCGKIVKSIAKGQLIEMQATEVVLYGAVEENCPITKAGLPLEVLRQHQHLRVRTNVIAAVMRIRDQCAFAIHAFFRERGFKYVHTPIITSNDCESVGGVPEAFVHHQGAGECFTITTLIHEDHKTKKPAVKDVPSFAEDFFGRKAMLTVSGQLNVETYCAGLAKVYTFGPTFRAEESYTTRHLSEFWMIEPEIWFAGLPDIMKIAEDFLKYVISHLLSESTADLLYLDAYHKRVAEGKSSEEKDAQQQAKTRLAEGGLIDRLLHIVKEPFAHTTYTNAIELLTKAEASGAVKFTETPSWGMDMGAEHERYLCEQMFKKPTIVTNYPRKIKAFYMKQDTGVAPGRETVQAMDILVPYIGEIIGGSAREDNLDKLIANMKDKDIPVEGLQWYLDLRRFGTAPHAGFGLGFERMILLVTGMLNIRDVIPFPRCPGLANH